MKLVTGKYEVTGIRDFRGHPQGMQFVARLDAGQEQRAIARGAIQLLARVTPALEPGTYRFPDGWLKEDECSRGNHQG